MRTLHSLAIFVAFTFASQLSAADKRPMTVADFFAVKRVAAPQISPDGKHVAYQVREVDLEKNKTFTALWITTTDGKGKPKLLLAKDMPGRESRWSPDGKHILFESKGAAVRHGRGGPKPGRSRASAPGPSHGIWSPDGKHIAFVSAVYPEFCEKPFAESDKLNKEKEDEIEKSPVKAKTFTKLFYRHWDEYVDDKRQHLFVIEFERRGAARAMPRT